MLRTSSSTDSSTSMTQIVVDYGGVDDGAITSMVRTSSSTDSSASAAQIVVEFDGVDTGGGGGGKSTKKLSKSRRIVKSWKTSKAWKVAKVVGLEEPSFLTSDTRLAFTKMGSRHTKLMMEDYWPWLKPLRIGGPTNCKHKSSCPHQLCLRRFRDMKSSSSRQVCGAQELSRYHFCFDYRQNKANGAADALSRATSEEPDLTLPHQVLIYGTPVLSLLLQF